MTDLLTIGATATQLYRQALSTVSNNIANINSEGYSRQEVTTAENSPSQMGVSYLGTGARLVGVQRAYDEFAEANIRTSQSALSSQGPMVNYTDRLLNLLGSETGGLSSAIDKFFSSATQLSTNPAEQSYRQEFLSSANFFSSRVKSVVGDLGALDTEMKREISENVQTLNQLAASLAQVNRQLGKNTKQSLQPPAMLDQRDHLMHEMSKLAKLDLTFDVAGRVDVKLAGTTDNTIIVKGNEAKTLSATFPTLPGSPSAVIFDAYGENINVGTIKGGSIGGLLSFRDDVFEPLRGDIDILVSSLVNSVNTVHAGGMNHNNEIGQDLFSLATTYKATSQNGKLDASVTATQITNGAPAAGAFSASWSSADRSWLVTDKATGAVSSVKPSTSSGAVFEHAGLLIELSESPKDGRSVFIDPALRVSENLSVAITDIAQIATSGRLVVQQSINNSKLVDVSLDYGYAKSLTLSTATLDAAVRPNFLESATVKANTSEPALRIQKGSDGFSITIHPSLSSDEAIQVFTSQRNHLAGTELDATFKTSLASSKTMEAGAAYLAEYVNKTGNAAYLDTGFTLGASAKESLLSFGLPQQKNNSETPINLIDNGHLTLNGTSLGALELAGGATLSATDVATWANSITDTTKVTATASNVITIDPTKFDSTRRLSINGENIISNVAPTTTGELVSLINAKSGDTNVEASIARDGNLIIKNVGGFEGDNIVLGSPDAGETTNFLGRGNGAVVGRVYYQGDDINFGFLDYWSGNGTAQDLAKIGLATTLTSDKEVAEDLLVHVTGAGTEAKLQYRVGDINAQSELILEQPLELKFVSATQVEIRDTTTNTLLATRTYESAKDIEYGDLRLRFSQAPSTGDVYTIKPNAGGIGDNTNILALAGIQNQRLESGEIPVQTYVTLVNNIGSVNSLSKMSAEALEVVYDDAVALGDAASGVSLDDEAANLIRFQQAYQAAAQIIKVSGELFDTILSASR